MLALVAFVTYKTMLSFFLWFLKTKGKDPPVSKHSYLCSEHFSEDCFMWCVGGKRYLKNGSVPTRFSFSPEEKSKRKALVYRSAACEETKHQVKDEVILNSQSNPVDNLVELESVNIPCQEYGFPSVNTHTSSFISLSLKLRNYYIKNIFLFKCHY